MGPKGSSPADTCVLGFGLRDAEINRAIGTFLRGAPAPMICLPVMINEARPRRRRFVRRLETPSVRDHRGMKST